MLTPLARTLRELREQRGLRLLDLAGRLGYSVAFISAIETGRKPVPWDFVTKIQRAMQLSEAEVERLDRAAIETRRVVNVAHLNEAERELVATFARRMRELPPEVVQDIRRRVKHPSRSSDEPFDRRLPGIIVKPRARDQLWQFAETVRLAFVDAAERWFPIVDVLEWHLWKIFPDFYLEIRNSEEMGEDEGRVIARDDRIVLRQDVYERACGNDGRARFTAAHELGHWFMHRNVGFARTRTPADPIVTDSEWQADTFAGALLLPQCHAMSFYGPQDASIACGVTRSAARVQLEKYREGK